MLLWLTSLPRPWATKEQLSCLTWPERMDQKTQRLLAWAKKTARQRECPHWEASVLWVGVNTATTLVENKKSILVVIAHVVDPIKLVAFLPALCHKMGVPYRIFKGKARLGYLVHRGDKPHRSPAHRLTQKTKGLWLSCWKLSGDQLQWQIWWDPSLERQHHGSKICGSYYQAGKGKGKRTCHQTGLNVYCRVFCT